MMGKAKKNREPAFLLLELMMQFVGLFVEEGPALFVFASVAKLIMHTHTPPPPSLPAPTYPLPCQLDQPQRLYSTLGAQGGLLRSQPHWWTDGRGLLLHRRHGSQPGGHNSHY